MRKVSRMLTVLAALAGFGATASPADAIALKAAASEACQETAIYQPDGGLYNQTRALTAVGVSCTKARQIARRYLSSGDSSEPDTSPFGFACTASSARVTCVRASRRVRWSYYGRSDPSCPNAKLKLDGVGYDVTAAGMTCKTAHRLIAGVVTERNGRGRSCTVARPCSHAHYRCVSQELPDLEFRVRCFTHGRRFAFTGGSE